MCDANNPMSNRDPTGSPIFCADDGYAALSGLLVKTHGCEEAGSANAFVAIREWNDWIQTVTDAKYPVVWETPTSNYLPPAGYCGTTTVRDNLIQADLNGADTNKDKIQGGEELFQRWSFLGQFSNCLEWSFSVRTAIIICQYWHKEINLKSFESSNWYAISSNFHE